MLSIYVFKFDSADGAERMLELVHELGKSQLICPEDVALVSWEQGKNKPKTSDLDGRVDGSLSGAFWGMLFGLIFFAPGFGMAFAASMGALSGKFTSYGIGKHFITQVREAVTEGTSALFLLGSQAVKVQLSEAARQKGWRFEVISVGMNDKQLVQLRQDFGTG